MIRPTDKIELRRRLLADSISDLRGSDLKRAKDHVSIRVNSRTSALQIGWVTAFTQFPFQYNLYTKDKVKVEILDVEFGVASQGLIVCEPDYEGERLAVRPLSTTRLYVVDSILPDLEKFLPLIKASSLTFPFDGPKALKETRRAELGVALGVLLGRDLRAVLRRALGVHGEKTVDELLKVADIAARITNGGDSSYYADQLVTMIMSEVGGKDIAELTLNELLSEE